MRRIVCLAGILAVAVGIGCVQSQPLETSDQLFRPAIRAALETLFLEYRLAIWPSAEQLEKALPISEVPAGVLEQADRWIRMMVRDEWLPQELKSHFIPLTMRVPFIPPEDVDYLMTRYEVGGHRIQLVEENICVAVLIAPPQSEPISAAAEEYLTRSARQYLNLPEDRIGSTQFELTQVDLGEDGTLYYGTMECEDNVKDAHPMWWHHSNVCTDGRLVYFWMLKRDGSPVEATHARPGCRSRF